MIKNKGRLFESITEKMKSLGRPIDGVEIATLGRGPDHIVLQNGETIGEYNHVSKRLFLYEDNLRD